MRFLADYHTKSPSSLVAQTLLSGLFLRTASCGADRSVCATENGLRCLLSLFFTILFSTNFLCKAQETYNLAPGKKITLTDATFQQGSAVLEESQRQVFMRLVEYLSKRDRLNIEIGGHADNQGNAAQNVALSLARAEAVRTFLVENGISVSRIRTCGYGIQFPIADNATPEGRTKNRRVEIIGLSALTGRLLVSPDGKPLPPEARISAIKPSVGVMSAWEGDWRDAVMDEPLYEAFRVNTSSGAWLDVTFRNKSTMHVSENATLFVYGFEAASKLASQPLPDGTARREIAKNIELEKGDLMLKLREMKARDTFSVRTKNSQIGFNTVSANASAKVRVDERKRSIISVLQGRANVQVLDNDPRTGQTLDVQEDFGVVVGGDDAPLGVQPLPKMPELLEPPERVPPSAEPMLFRWKNAGFTTRLEVASNAEFTEFVYNNLARNGEANVFVPEGTYFVRLTNIDSIGFESQSLVRALVVNQGVEPSSALPPFRFRWLEFGFLVIAGGCFYASLLFHDVRLRYAALVCVGVSVLMFIFL
jgi:hypothetical protein